ncbi:lecithin retinol acyltransferase family protein [Paenibacillus sp. HGH0039]|uniref:lecithin retinol acyltransferase family protein n=1 Tax=Paenibacillus sp. HGH0039 TaxID=1078505 RepID=UPI00034E24EF|nr:lecithin retinol acyltransferase family protein [Paenibacillus sp. HGH0039]EPD81322.1 hypothetical protein HMPREF1207_05079 [Paenibacillus sp. HGH0039]
MPKKIHGFWSNLGSTITGISSAFSDLKEGVRSDAKQLKNDLKQSLSEGSPRLAKTIESMDRTNQTINNMRRSIPLTLPQKNKLYGGYTIVRSNTDIQPASHLMVRRFGYEHHGLAINNEDVIHYTDLSIQIGSIKEFQGDSKIYIINSVCLYSVEKIIERAYSRLSETQYNVLVNNCEHFVNWCRSGNENNFNI